MHPPGGPAPEPLLGAEADEISFDEDGLRTLAVDLALDGGDLSRALLAITEPAPKIHLAGRFSDDAPRWEILGVFDSVEDAEDAIERRGVTGDFVASVERGVDLPDEADGPPECRFPLGRTSDSERIETIETRRLVSFEIPEEVGKCVALLNEVEAFADVVRRKISEVNAKAFDRELSDEGALEPE